MNMDLAFQDQMDQNNNPNNSNSNNNSNSTHPKQTRPRRNSTRIELSPDKQIDMEIRLSFLEFFVYLFKDYRKYVTFLRKYPKPVAIFHKAKFLKEQTHAVVIIFATNNSNIVEIFAIVTFYLVSVSLYVIIGIPGPHLRNASICSLS